MRKRSAQRAEQAWMGGARWLILLPLLVQPACPSNECVSLDPSVPTPAIECQAGHLCYQGDCIQACTAGQELAQACTSDDNCDRTRPTCNDGFCSACDEGLVCIPTLNICRELSGAAEPPPPAPPGQPPPPALDGGWIDGGIKVGEDAGEPPPIERIVTHAGLIDVAQIDDRGSIRSEVSVEILHVGDVMDPELSWFIDPPSPPASETIIARAGACVLSSLTTYSASIAFPPANLGDLSIFAPIMFAGSITTSIAIPWNGADYQVPPLPADLLRYSLDGAPSFIRIESGAGSPITRGGWPDPIPDLGEHVPFELTPAPATGMLLATGALVEIAPDGTVADDLTFAWSSVPFVNFELVTLRIRSADHAFRCSAMEVMGEPESTMIVPRDLLASFALRAGLAETTLPLHFERSFTRDINILPANDQIIDVSIRIRHTIESTIRFDQR